MLYNVMHRIAENALSFLHEIRIIVIFIIFQTYNEYSAFYPKLSNISDSETLYYMRKSRFPLTLRINFITCS